MPSFTATSLPPASLLQPAWQCLGHVELPWGVAAPEQPYGTAKKAATPNSDHDGHWKDALETWLQDCVTLLWPKLHGWIDWHSPPQFMDKELRRAGGTLYRDRRYVDKLVQLQARGRPTLLLLHAEVQAHLERNFAERMFHYYTRLRARYPEHDLLQFAIITQGKNLGKIRRVEYNDAPLSGNFLRLSYSTPVIHLQDWQGQEAHLAELAASNPFALVVLAELHAAANPAQPANRLDRKLQLVRALYRYRYPEKTIRQLFLFIDSTLKLPAELDETFSQALETLEQEQNMAYISSVERVGIRKGIQQGLQQGLLTLLQQRFGPLPAETVPRLQQASAQELQHWLQRILKAKTLQDVFTPS